MYVCKVHMWLKVQLPVFALLSIFSLDIDQLKPEKFRKTQTMHYALTIFLNFSSAPGWLQGSVQ